MPMHSVHKILADHCVSPRSTLEVGEIVEIQPDVFAIGVDRNGDEARQLVDQLNELGVKELPLHGRIFGFFDHAAPAPFPAAAAGQKEWTKLLRSYNIPITDAGAGISHIILPERGVVSPGSLVVISDSHTPTMGAVGAYASCLAGGTLSLLAVGRWWMDVPAVDLYVLKGELQPGVLGRDVSLHVNGKVGQQAALGRVIEFAGPYVETLSMDMRFTLCNASTEMGATAAYIQPDDITRAWLQGRSTEYRIYTSDADFEYEQILAFDVSTIVPQIAAPHAPDNVFPIDEFEGIRIDQAFIGSCASGRLEDIAVAAEVIKGRTVHPDVRLIVTPGSREIALAAMRAGYLEDLNEAGAIVTHANCGSCAALHGGILAPGDVAISCNTRNFRGRMGPGAEIYLASPATVSASAIAGKITDPRRVLPNLGQPSAAALVP